VPSQPTWYLIFVGRAGSPTALFLDARSLPDAVTATLAKHACIGRRKEALLALTGVCDLGRKLLRWARQGRLLTGVTLELGDADALLLESKLNVLQRFLGVQSDLDATCTNANSLHVVLVECHVDDILGS